MRKKGILLLFFTLLVFVLLGFFMPEGILMDPQTVPADFLINRPFISLFDGRLTLIVPSSTLIVYLLGVLVLFLAWRLRRDGHWRWAISFLLWGIGTILAGTSYQGFGYMLKCSGRDACLFTSWFELAYLFMTAFSMTWMSVAFANLFLKGPKRQGLIGYGWIALGLYTVLLLLGSILSIRFLISYELFTLFFMPLFLVFFIINVLEYRKQKDDLNKTFIRLWLIFLVVNVAYYIYYFLGITDTLYHQTGLWFSANDVLHIGIALWMLYILFAVRKRLPKNV